MADVIYLSSLLTSMSHFMRKHVFGGLRPGKTQTGLQRLASLEIRNSASFILSWQQTTKVLIRLRWCTSWPAPLFAYGIRHIFSWPGSHVFCIHPFSLFLLYISFDYEKKAWTTDLAHLISMTSLVLHVTGLFWATSRENQSSGFATS